ncbi:MAG: hypothetical protein ACJAZQ_002359 [Cognaticolwellia sp.]|jgi:hypothetical protein
MLNPTVIVLALSQLVGEKLTSGYDVSVTVM